MSTALSIGDIRPFVLDLAERAASAAWQGAAGAAVPILLAVDSQHVVSAAWWQQIGAITLAGAVSAIGSLLKGIRAGVKTGTASLSATVAQTAVVSGAHATDTPRASLSLADPPFTPTPPLPIDGATPPTITEV